MELKTWKPGDLAKACQGMLAESWFNLFRELSWTERWRVAAGFRNAINWADDADALNKEAARLLDQVAPLALAEVTNERDKLAATVDAQAVAIRQLEEAVLAGERKLVNVASERDRLLSIRAGLEREALADRQRIARLEQDRQAQQGCCERLQAEQERCGRVEYQRDAAERQLCEAEARFAATSARLATCERTATSLADRLDGSEHDLRTERRAHATTCHVNEELRERLRTAQALGAALAVVVDLNASPSSVVVQATGQPGLFRGEAGRQARPTPTPPLATPAADAGASWSPAKIAAAAIGKLRGETVFGPVAIDPPPGNPWPQFHPIVGTAPKCGPPPPLPSWARPIG